MFEINDEKFDKVRWKETGGVTNEKELIKDNAEYYEAVHNLPGFNYEAREKIKMNLLY